MWVIISLVLLLTSNVLCVLIPSLEHPTVKRAFPQRDPIPVQGDVGSRLILTPYIEAGNIEKARNLSSVTEGPFDIGIPSYSGFFTVNTEYNSHLFFWFFPAEYDYENAPVLLWIEGGPGVSSLYTLFKEMGPFDVAEDLSTLVKNPYSWHKNHSLIFIDNPVGTGFSYTDYDEGYATEQTQVGEELYSAIIQFFTMFPDLQHLPFFISGESYAGKYVPAIGYTIHQRNPTADLKINLKGLVVGNGFTDPITALAYSEYLFQVGLIDTNTSEEMKQLEDTARQLILDGKVAEAYFVWDGILNLFTERSKYVNIYNFLYDIEPVVGGSYPDFVQKEEVRKALHVGDAEFTEMGIVYDKMIPDIMDSVRPWLEELLEHYRVLYYSGGVDVIVAYPLSVNMYNVLEFSAAEEYRKAERVPWYVDGKLAGYFKSAGNFTEMMVRNAGHSVPTDQPISAFDMIYRFTRNNITKT